MRHEICPDHDYENLQMEKYQKLYDKEDWGEIQRVRDLWYSRGKGGMEERDNEFYEWSHTIEENFKRKEVIPNTDENPVDFDEIMSLYQKIDKSKTQIEEQMYEARIKELKKALKPIVKETLTPLQQDIWAMHFGGKGPVDIGRKLGKTHQTICEQLDSIKIKLKEQVKNL